MSWDKELIFSVGCNPQEKKKAKKLRDARRARGEEVSDSEDED